MVSNNINLEVHNKELLSKEHFKSSQDYKSKQSVDDHTRPSASNGNSKSFSKIMGGSVNENGSLNIDVKNL